VGASASDIKAANETVKEVLGNVPAGLRQIVLAIGLFESGYGLSGSWLKADGSPSYNWGALVGSGTAGSIDHGDRDRDGNPYTTPFMAFHTMRQGFERFMKTFAKPDQLAAAERGSARDTAAAMYRHGYFTGVKGSDADRINAYAGAILNTSKQIAQTLGEPLAVSLKGSSSTRQAALYATAAAGAVFLAGAPIIAVVSAPLLVYWLSRR
jgi:hypothetical protein